MPAYRGRGHDAELVAVSPRSLSLPNTLRKTATERAQYPAAGTKYPRQTRMIILLAGIVGSWSLLLYLLSFVPF